MLLSVHSRLFKPSREPSGCNAAGTSILRQNQRADRTFDRKHSLSADALYRRLPLYRPRAAYNRRNSAPGDERNGFIWQIFRDVDAEKLRINEAKPTDRHCHAQRQPKLAKPGAAVTSTNIIPREHQPDSPTVQTLTNIGEPFPPTANINESPRRAWFRRPWAFDQVSHGGGPAPNNSIQRKVRRRLGSSFEHMNGSG